eukprot:TRINITY_DN5101_c1_g2_i10.p1 TRINITY_DN5101_c1_g2~~TRINITY_DN5101_c1_g2_i10.p1  ORF type:complete len:157 (-),score=1.03 TRINITY_DN5101_c1_g2_i10:560-1030(-)
MPIPCLTRSFSVLDKKPLTQLSLHSTSAHDLNSLLPFISSSRNVLTRSTSKLAEKRPCFLKKTPLQLGSHKVSHTPSTSRTPLNTNTIINVAQKVTMNGGWISGKSLAKVVNVLCHTLKCTVVADCRETVLHQSQVQIITRDRLNCPNRNMEKRRS